VSNILIDALPDAVEIDGQDVALDTDFRTALRVILAFEDDELTAVEKQAILLDNLYLVVPPNVQRAWEQGVKFLDGGEEPEGSDAEPLRVYSFSQDAALIFAAFRQTHGIDLQAVEHLHWWVFLALFNDLGAETTFCQLVSLRRRIKTGKASKEERQMAQEMRDWIDLPEPDTRTAEEREREDEFMRLVMEGEKRRADLRRQNNGGAAQTKGRA